MEKRLVSAFAVPFVLSLAMPGQIQAATVIGFEGGADPLFTYSGVDFVSTPVSDVSGYNNVAAFSGSTWVAFNAFEATPSSFFIAGSPAITFTLHSFVISGAWGSQTLTVEGFNNGNLLFSSALGISLTSKTFSPSWTGIDELRISTGSDFVDDPTATGIGTHWALDNLTITPIPEPEVYAMLLAGLGLLGFMAHRKE